ncbi:MAG: GntR family transcriptional regulator [Gemmatimonadales bacterium]
MFADLDPKSPVPLYEQIAVWVKAAVSTGEIRAGDLLPSVRELAGQHRINPATVTQAYRSLEVDGFVELRQGAGTFVRSVPGDTRARERAAQARRLVREMLASAARFGLARHELQDAIRHELDGGSR